MSTTDEVVAQLKAHIKEFEKKELTWKEEHAQLINFQKKLAQAGSHLKTLAQENASLTKSLAERNKEKQALLDEKTALETKHQEEVRQYEEKTALLKSNLDTSREGHEKEIKQLVDILETAAKSMDGGAVAAVATPPIVTPDVSTSTLLDNYMKSVQKRLSRSTELKKANKKDMEKEFELKMAELKQEIKELQSKDNTESIQTSLQSLLDDPENGTIDNSLPPSLLIILEKVRSTLQDQKEAISKSSQHSKASIEEAQHDLKRQITQLNIQINELTEEKERLLSEKDDMSGQVRSLEKDIAALKTKLIESEKQKQSSQEREKQLSKEHQSLLGKLSHIKETLTPRLEQDKQLRQKVSDLGKELEVTKRELEKSREDMMMRDEETSSEIERQEQTIAELSDRLEKVQSEREEYESLAMQLDAQCSQVGEQLQSSQQELEKLKVRMAEEQTQHESERASLSNLQTVLEEFQTTKDAEMRAAVEHIERQLAVAKKSWAEYEERAHTAETALEKYQQDVGKTQKYEKEIKEKNLLIGKLRHEAIILNEHLVEAMRKLKEETSENNVDRQLITNLLVGFFLAPRGDRKRYDILTIISNVLQLTEEQKEQIGLSRPKNGGGGSGGGAAHLLPSPIMEQPQKESFTDAWISFLLKESNPLRRNRSAVTLSPSSMEENNIEL